MLLQWLLGSRLSSGLGQLFGSNPVAVLTTVILMSYIKLLQTTVDTLTSTNLHFSNGTSKRVWRYDGNIAFFEGKHAVIGLFAIIVITLLLVPYILLLTFGYCLQAYSGKRGCLWLNKLKPLFDAYYAPYNKKTRFWTGLMLIVRVFLFILSDYEMTANLLATVSVFTIIAVFSLLNGGIYHNSYINTLERSFVLNILLLSMYHIGAAGSNSKPIATYVSVGIALAKFLGIVIFYSFLRIKKLRCLGKQLFEDYEREPKSYKFINAHPSRHKCCHYFNIYSGPEEATSGRGRTTG